MVIKIEIHLPPMASPRPRFSKRGNFVQTYMPSAYTEYKRAIRAFTPKLLLEEALKVDVIFVMPIPQSLSKKKRESLDGEYHTKKPDIDNLLKTVLDACNGIVWIDDNVVCNIHARKVYGLEPCTKIEITTINEE